MGASEPKVISRGSFFLTVAVAVVAVIAFQYSMKNDIAAASRAATDAGALARAAMDKANEVERSVYDIGRTLARIEETLVWIRKALEANEEKVKAWSERDRAQPGGR